MLKVLHVWRHQRNLLEKVIPSFEDEILIRFTLSFTQVMGALNKV